MDAHLAIRSVTELGGRSRVWSPARPLAAAGPVEVGPGLSGLQPLRDIEAVIRHELVDVVLEGSFHLIRRGALFVAESLYGVGRMRLERSLAEMLPLAAAPEGPTYVLGANWTATNYFHWIVQALPAMRAWLPERPRRGWTLVLPELVAWQEETLAMLGLAGAARLTVPFASRMHLPNVAFANPLVGEGATSDLVVDTIRRLKRAAGGPVGGDLRLYVSRGDTAHRRVTNEDEVAAEMRRRGFAVVDPGLLTVAEQIGLFDRAAIVAGPHGAGLTNLAFCNPGTRVYELVPRLYANDCFCRLAQRAGLHYRADGFEGPPQPDGAWIGHADMSVHMDVLMRGLDRIAPGRVSRGWIGAAWRRGRR